MSKSRHTLTTAQTTLPPMRGFSLIGAFINAAAAMITPEIAMSRNKPRMVRTWRIGGHNRPHEGDGERERRRRQIRVGSLRVQNGLDPDCNSARTQPDSRRSRFLRRVRGAG